MTVSTPNPCVLFVGICDSAQFHEKLGDTEANHVIDRCINRIERATAVHKGRIVKTVGEVLVTAFSAADDALLAACEMQQRIEALPPAAGIKMSIRVAFQHSVMLGKNTEVDGEAVALAARMVELAKPGQILTTAETLAILTPSLRESARALGLAEGGGQFAEQRLFALSWHGASDLPMLHSIPPSGITAVIWLRLVYGTQELILNRFKAKATLGRGTKCDIIINDPRASRSHALIERRDDKFVLIDQSANGTYLSINGAPDVALKHEEAVLVDHGHLSFGHHCKDAGEEVVAFQVITKPD
jgi:adenylate cyclase